MKKLVRVGVLFGIVALLLLAVGSAAAQDGEPTSPPVTETGSTGQDDDSDGYGQVPKGDVEIKHGYGPYPVGGGATTGAETETVSGGATTGAENATATEPVPGGAAARISFASSSDSAVEGIYVVKEVLGGALGYWIAKDGWEYSGWGEYIDISADEVWVEVLYYPPGSDADTAPTVMTILNHAPGQDYGWLAEDIANTLEVEFPD